MVRVAAFLVSFALVACVGAAEGARFAEPSQLRVAFVYDVDSLDPAAAKYPEALEIEYLTCARLFVYTSRRDGRTTAPVPEVAAGPPAISRDRKTYVFTIRRGFRFSNGAPVSAANFATAIDRVLSPTMHADWQRQWLSDVVGADAVTAGKADHAVGVRVRGNRLSVRLSKPAGDLVERIAWLPQFCPVPTNLPSDPIETLPSSGPYLVAARVPNESIELRRNRFYGGKRPRRPASIVVTIGGTQESNLEAAERGQVDIPFDGPTDEALPDLVRRYGIGRRQLFFRPRPTTFFLAMNSDRPLFRNNLALRRAVNFALDRPAILRQQAFSVPRLDDRIVTDRIVPRGIPGARSARLYSRSLAVAARLARRHLRSGKAVLYINSSVEGLKRAAVVKRDLAAIGLAVEVKSFARPVLNAKVSTRGEPFDLAFVPWIADYLDPGAILVPQLDGRTIRDAGNTDVSYFNDPKVNRELAAADRLTGRARYRAFGALDVQIMRTKAPFAPLWDGGALVFVAKRVGCVASVAHLVDYGALCLRAS